MLQTPTTTLRLLAKRWLTLAEELKALDTMLDMPNRPARPRERFGVGPQTAAVLVAVAGDNPKRLKSDHRTRSYVTRRTKETHRCLKRCIVRELYPLILADLTDSALAA